MSSWIATNVEAVRWMGSAEGIRDWEQACGGEGEGGVIDASGCAGGYAASSAKKNNAKGSAPARPAT